MHRYCPAAVALFVSAVAFAGCSTADSTAGHAARHADNAKTGNVIFVHPDGASAATYVALRNIDVGPDGDLNWDKLPAMALYRGHMRNSLTATSNGGATAHAYGVKPWHDAFGMTGGPEPQLITDDAVRSRSVAHQAMRHGLSVGLVQSGVSVEPGTAAFLTSVEKRAMHDAIAAQLIESGADVLLSGGERDFLPRGAPGFHGPGTRQDNRNLIDEAVAAGYDVVYTLDQLRALPDDVDKVLGLFAHASTFNDKPEEVLAEQGLPLYDPDAPTLAEMTEHALRILSAKDRRFLLVIEEEGTDNFGNNNNAGGVIEAARRADETFGLCMGFIDDRPDTLLLTCADSDGGGMRVIGYPKGAAPDAVAARARNGSPQDGINGAETPPFTAAPDRFGQRLKFRVAWSAFSDVSGGVLVRGSGLNSDRIHGSFDNTDVPELIRLTLFGATEP